MNSLLQSQIRENCKLSLPNGLTDLMSDISREVLRAQPQNVYQFIANYLEALLEVREVLSIAHHVCNEMCGYTYETELQNELKAIGLDEEDTAKALNVIQEHFESGAVNEPSLFIKLVKKTSIDDFYVPAIQEAILNAFKRHQLKNVKAKYSQSNHYDETTKAVRHTMNMYGTSKPKTEELFVSTHVKPSVKKVFLNSKSPEYYEVNKCKHETNDLHYSSEIPEEQSLNIDFASNALDIEFEKIKDRTDVNFEIGDDNIKDVSDNDNDIEHPGSFMRDFDKVKNEDFIQEEIVSNGDSENDSIVCSVDKSLRNRDNSYDSDEVF